MNNRSLYRPHLLASRLLTSRLLTTAVVGIIALIGGFALANGPVARAAMEKVGLLQAVPAIPETFNYQGFLREADGSLTTGTKNITSKIYAVPTGGTAIHTEEFANVNVRDGLFNIVIGDATPLGTTFNTAPLYIGISVDGTELIPRERVHGVPWAIRATKAQEANYATSAGSANSATNATNAENAENATTADQIAPGAIRTFQYSAQNSSSATLNFSQPFSNTHACFLSTAFGTSNTISGGTGDRSDCQIVGNKLEAGFDSTCRAMCIQWGQ